MKQKLFAVVTLVFVLSLVTTVNASYGLGDGVDGYVNGNGLPAEGITVRVYNAADALEGYGVNDDNSQGALGTDVTDANGYFHIAWLYAHSGTYKVVAETPVGDLIQYVTVNCGATTRVCFSYSCGDAGLSPGFWKHNVGVYLGYSPGSYSDPVGSAVVSQATMGDWLASLGLNLEALYEDLSTKGGGAAGAATRVGAANVFNALAGLQPYAD